MTVGSVTTSVRGGSQSEVASGLPVIIMASAPGQELIMEAATAMLRRV